MNWNRRNLAWILALIVAVPLAADEPAASAGQPEMSAEEKAMMEAMTKAGTPGPEHHWLASTAGGWEFRGTSWTAPDSPPTEFAGTEERTLIHGGRAMVAKVVSEFFGQPFEGMGMSGFDNVSKKWWGIWNDNMTTGAMTMSGECKDGRCVYESWGADPMTGKMVKGRMTSEHQADHEHHVMYATGADGKEFRAMEFHYTRKK